MMYTMARFGRDSPTVSLVETIQETFKDTVAAASLAVLVKKKRAKVRSDERAKATVTLLMDKMDRSDEEESTPTSLLRKVLSKVLKFIGKRILKAVVRPILRFAARVVMTLVRTVAQALMRYAIVPLFEFAASVIIANPITAAIVGVLAAAGGGYLLWKSFFKDKAVPSSTSSGGESDSAGGGQAYVPGQTEPADTYTKTFGDYINAPIDYAKDLFSSKKFSGFGSNIDAYIREASAMSGIREDVLRGFVKMEAGWTGKMSPTGAIGTGQFTQPTWDALARTSEGAAIGMTVIGSRFRTPQDPRWDMRVNTLATGLLAAQNAQLLREAGLPVTGENLYMLHNIGPGIIPVMLGQPASPQTIKAMMQNGMISGQTASQFLAYQKSRFNVAYRDANSESVLAAEAVRYSDGITLDTKVQAVSDATTGNSTQPLATKSSKDKVIIKGKGSSLIEVS